MSRFTRRLNSCALRSRRVYTRSHLDFIGEVAKRVMENPKGIKGLRVTWAPEVLRHFMAELEEVE